MATCAPVRVCDVPIDLDGSNSTDLNLLDLLEQEQEQEQKAAGITPSTHQVHQVPLPPQRQASTSTSSWSSSSGSFYSDEEDDGEPFSLRLSLSTSSPPTSPLVNSAKCWWTTLSPKENVSPKSSSSDEDMGESEWSSSSDTHDSGYFSRPHTMDDKPCDLEVHNKERLSNQPSQVGFTCLI
ncbi:hypothetical protein CPB86DRAFT_414742 [Serendipita vermifera]|nr:hypothetical protein CPB86DRAFT_414742 [Serendipita vermifera]